MDVTKVVGLVGEIQTVSTVVLGTIGTLDPVLLPETVLVSGLVKVLGSLVGKALSAYSEAAGVPITSDSILALLPDMTPLPLPVDVPHPVASVPVPPSVPMMYGPEVWAGRAAPVPVVSGVDVPQPGPGMHNVFSD